MKEFEDGVAFSGGQLVGLMAAELGDDYIGNVECAIEDLYRRMNAFDRYKDTFASQESLKGFLFEEWAAGTANVDAAVKALPRAADVLVDERSLLGSPDVRTSDEALYQLKMWGNPVAAVKELGTTLFDRYKSSKASGVIGFEEWAASKGFGGKAPSDLLYEGQFSMVSSDMLDACRQNALKRLQEAQIHGNVFEVNRWKAVFDGLTDRIRLDNGVESSPLSYEDARQKAIAVTKKQLLKPSDDNMTLEDLIRINNIMRQALKAGATSAMISAVLKIVPEIYRSIDFLIKEGKLDLEHLRSLGAATVDGAATGFVNGTASAAITVAAGKGVFGEVIKSALAKPIGASVIGALVVLTVETLKDTYALSRGKLTINEFANHVTQGVYISILSLVGLGVATIVAPQVTIPALIGSMAGSAIGALSFSPLHACILRLSQETGLTFFGVVEQDFEIPDALLRKLGIRGAEYKTADVDVMDIRSTNPKVMRLKRSEFHTLDVAFIERNIIGLNKVGYVMT